MPEGDVYWLEGFSNDAVFRSFVKRMLLMMINAASKEKARKAIHKAVKVKKTMALPDEIKSTKACDIYPVMDAFEQKHEPISKYFCTGAGVKLQYLDSQIAEQVMLHFAKMHDYAILPMHDSFILHHGLEGELQLTMDKAFFDMFGVHSKVDLKYNSIDERSKVSTKRDDDDLEECTLSLPEMLAERKPYSVYFELLEEHRRLYG
jgi:hypothetical protein